MDRANGAGPGATAASRAERFEDEKRRIIESCFSKKDNDGSRKYSFDAVARRAWLPRAKSSWRLSCVHHYSPTHPIRGHRWRRDGSGLTAR